MRFNFRLQQFLGIKEQIEEQKELEYGAALRILAEERATLDMLQQQREETIEHMREQVSKQIDPREIRILNNQIERLKNMIVMQTERVQQAEAHAEIKRQELVIAMQNRKAIERVRDVAYEDFLKEADLQSRKTVDELVSYRYTKSRA